jgi:hypothetical protein
LPATFGDKGNTRHKSLVQREEEDQGSSASCSGCSYGADSTTEQPWSTKSLVQEGRLLPWQTSAYTHSPDAAHDTHQSQQEARARARVGGGGTGGRGRGTEDGGGVVGAEEGRSGGGKEEGGGWGGVGEGEGEREGERMMLRFVVGGLRPNTTWTLSGRAEALESLATVDWQRWRREVAPNEGLDLVRAALSGVMAPDELQRLLQEGGDAHWDEAFYESLRPDEEVFDALEAKSDSSDMAQGWSVTHGEPPRDHHTFLQQAQDPKDPYNFLALAAGGHEHRAALARVYQVCVCVRARDTVGLSCAATRE